MKTLAILLALATFTFAAPVLAGTEPAVGVTALKSIEKAANEQFAPTGADPWDLVGDTRGTYIPGYGTFFTFELSLVNVTPIFPFHPTASPQDIKDAHDRKIKKLPVLKAAIRDLMVKAATTLTGMPGGEQIAFETYFFSFSFEDHTNLPRRLTMSANRQKLLDAVTQHATAQAIAALIEEREE